MRVKLFLTYLLIGFIPLVAFALTISNGLADYFANQRGVALKYLANQLAISIDRKNYLFDELKRPLFDEELEAQSRNGNRVIVVDKMAYVVNDSSKSQIGKTLMNTEIMEALSGNNVARLKNDSSVMYAAVQIENKDKEIVGAVLIIAPIDEINLLLNDVRMNLVTMAIPLGIIVVVLVVIISYVLLNPAKRLLEAVQRMTDGQLSSRVTVKGRDEFAELSAAFNNMCNQLERVETTRQEFVSNVSHELKTPLSSMKVLSEAIITQENIPKSVYREFLVDINSEIDRMTMIINELLTLVKLDRTENPLTLRSIRLNKIIEELLKRLYPLAEQKNIELLYEDVKQVFIDADEIKLSLALSNLIENAIKYTESGGTVKVIIDSDNQNAYVTVIDTGIGITEEEQPKVFNRFYRVDKTRDRETGGTGLGLSITHKTVLLHNGSIKLSSKLGEGSAFVVRLPLHQPLVIAEGRDE